MILIIIIGFTVIYALWAEDMLHTNVDTNNTNSQTGQWRLPQAVSFMDDAGGIVDIQTHGRNTLLLDTDGNLWGWGTNLRGLLGMSGGTTAADAATIAVPTLIPNQPWQSDGAHVVDFAVGGRLSVVVDSLGRLWSAGNFHEATNTAGSPGAGAIAQHTFRRVGASMTEVFVAADAGEQHIIALCSAGNVFTAGSNLGNGLLGRGNQNGAHDMRTTLVQVPNVTNAIGVSANEFASFAITSNQLWGWGAGGANGNDSANTAAGRLTTPAQIPPTDWSGSPIEIISGQRTTWLRTTTGIFSWGLEGAGALGRAVVSNNNRRPMPTLFSQHHASVVSMSIGNNNAYFLYRDASGTLRRYIIDNLAVNTDSLLLPNMEIVGVSSGMNVNSGGTRGQANSALTNALNFMWSLCGVVFVEGHSRLGAGGDGVATAVANPAGIRTVPLSSVGATLRNYTPLNINLPRGPHTVVADNSHTFIWQQPIPQSILQFTIASSEAVNQPANTGAANVVARRTYNWGGQDRRFWIFQGLYVDSALTIPFNPSIPLTMTQTGINLYARWQFNPSYSP